VGVAVTRPAITDLTGYGAARMAAIGLGASLPAAPSLGGITIFEPGRGHTWRAEQRERWRRAVQATIAAS